MKPAGAQIAALLRDPGPCRAILLFGEDVGMIRERAEALLALDEGDLDGAMGMLVHWASLLEGAAVERSGADWLAAALSGKTSLKEFSAEDLSNALSGMLPYALRRRLDVEAPTHYTAPTGSNVPIDYEAEGGPKFSIRVQEMFGVDKHPSIAGGRVPLVVELLSPGHKPVQVTRDLPGFWRGSYAAVRTEMRGRYPRHPWPDNPLEAPATRRAKPRGT